MNEGNAMSCDDGSARRSTLAAALAKVGADDADDQRPEPHAETDEPAPEEAGYGYGV